MHLAAINYATEYPITTLIVLIAMAFVLNMLYTFVSFAVYKLCCWYAGVGTSWFAVWLRFKLAEKYMVEMYLNHTPPEFFKSLGRKRIEALALAAARLARQRAVREHFDRNPK